MRKKGIIGNFVLPLCGVLMLSLVSVGLTAFAEQEDWTDINIETANELEVATPGELSKATPSEADLTKGLKLNYANEITGESVCKINGKGYGTIGEAVEEAEDGDTVTLLKDVTECVTVDGKTITLDLGGHTLFAKSDADFVIKISGGASVFLENGSIINTKVGGNAQGVQIIASGNALNPTEVYVSDDVNVKAYEFGITIFNTSDHSGTGLDITVCGTIEAMDETGGVGIFVNGNIRTSDNAVLTIEGATVTGGTSAKLNGDGSLNDCGAGMAINGFIDVVINSGTIRGASGIEIRAGSLTVNGGLIEGTYGFFVDSPSGSQGGNTSAGAGISINEHTTHLEITVVITGGEINGYYAIEQGDPNSVNDNQISLEIYGGTFTSEDENECVKVNTADGVTVNIFDGEFSNPESIKEFLADGVDLDKKEDSSDNTENAGHSGSGVVIRSGSGSSNDIRPSRDGQWIKGDKGWWYSYTDGSYPKNDWRQLEWNGNTYWYFFDQDGWMVTGWLEWNGRKYYLNPVSGDNQGYMFTGRHVIDGTEYYFDESGALIN